MTAPSLTEFLLARIAEDEAWVDADLYGGDRYRPHGRVEPDNPVRVKAECEAKRRIVERHVAVDYGTYEGVGAVTLCRECRDQLGPCVTLRALALPYADHPDYRQEWKP